MTVTPSKDRAEAHETPAEEFSRLVIEYNEGERQNRAEAWNLIADFACEHADTIIAAMNGTAHANGFAEGMKRATDALDKYRASLADIPLGHENPQRGASTYNWKVAVFEEIRDAILAEIPEAK